jgi:hypothetical protein
LASELVLLVITFLQTKDIVLLGSYKRFHGIAPSRLDRERDIDWLLKRHVDDTHGFRCLMRDTGGIIVGDFARTGEDSQEVGAEAGTYQYPSWLVVITFYHEHFNMN